MTRADVRVRSLDALARRALEHPSWPPGQRPAARSLAAIFGKLDRDHELGWLEDRIEVQQILAEVLSCPLADLRLGFQRPRNQEQSGGRRVRLDDVRYARSIDLLEEELCPGIPRRLLTPGSWQRLVWRAPSGSGRSLVGRWLEARGLARFVQARSLADAIALLPARGATFVELSEAHADDRLDRVADRERICVATRALPRGVLGSGFEVVESDPPRRWIAELAAWVADRLPHDTRFDAETAAQWLLQAPLLGGIVDTIGSALGLFGLIDELGLRELRGKSAVELARHVLRLRLAGAAERGSSDASWMRRAGFDAVVGIGKRLVTESDDAWDTPRSFDAWLELVPAEHRRGPDLEWLRLSLARTADGVRPADIERAARELPPGAFRIVRALESATLLRPDVSGGLRLAPRWFARAIMAEASRALVSGSPFEWGEALLRQESAPNVSARLLERFLRDDSGAIEQVLELDADQSASHVAALEAVCRTAGLALLDGAEISPEQLEPLWDEALRLSVDLDGLPRARIEHSAEAVAQAPELSSGAFFVALWAIAEQLPERSGKRQELFRPWLATTPPSGLRAALDTVVAALDAAPGNGRWQLEAFALVDRLRRTIGSVALDGGPSHFLELPGQVLDEVDHGVLEWSSLRGLARGMDRTAKGVAALEWLAIRRGIELDAVGRAIWNAWDTAGRPASALAQPSCGWSLAIWHELPRHLAAPLYVAAEGARAELARAFGDEQWSGIVDALKTDAALFAHLPALLTAMPREHARATFAARAPDGEAPLLLRTMLAQREALGVLWQRFPDLTDEIARGLRADGTASVALALAAPLARTRDAVLLLRRRLRASELPELDRDELLPVRRFLHECIRERATDFREAYALLDELERRLVPLRSSVPPRAP